MGSPTRKKKNVGGDGSHHDPTGPHWDAHPLAIRSPERTGVRPGNFRVQLPWEHREDEVFESWDTKWAPGISEGFGMAFWMSCFFLEFSQGHGWWTLNINQISPKVSAALEQETCVCPWPSETLYDRYGQWTSISDPSGKGSTSNRKRTAWAAWIACIIFLGKNKRNLMGNPGLNNFKHTKSS